MAINNILGNAVRSFFIGLECGRLTRVDVSVFRCAAKEGIYNGIVCTAHTFRTLRNNRIYVVLITGANTTFFTTEKYLFL